MLITVTGDTYGTNKSRWISNASETLTGDVEFFTLFSIDITARQFYR